MKVLIFQTGLLCFVSVLMCSLDYSECRSMITSFEQRQLAETNTKTNCVPPCKIFHSWCKNDGKCREKGRDCTWYCECPDNCEGFFCEKIVSKTNNAEGGVDVQVVYEQVKTKKVSSFDKSKLEQALANIFTNNNKKSSDNKTPDGPQTIDRVGNAIDVKETISTNATLYCPPETVLGATMLKNATTSESETFASTALPVNSTAHPSLPTTTLSSSPTETTSNTLNINSKSIKDSSPISPIVTSTYVHGQTTDIPPAFEIISSTAGPKLDVSTSSNIVTNEVTSGVSTTPLTKKAVASSQPTEYKMGTTTMNLKVSSDTHNESPEVPASTLEKIIVNQTLNSVLELSITTLNPEIRSKTTSFPIPEYQDKETNTQQAITTSVNIKITAATDTSNETTTATASTTSSTNVTPIKTTIPSTITEIIQPMSSKPEKTIDKTTPKVSEVITTPTVTTQLSELKTATVSPTRAATAAATEVSEETPTDASPPTIIKTKQSTPTPPSVKTKTTEAQVASTTTTSEAATTPAAIPTATEVSSSTTLAAAAITSATTTAETSTTSSLLSTPDVAQEAAATAPAAPAAPSAAATPPAAATAAAAAATTTTKPATSTKTTNVLASSSSASSLSTQEITSPKTSIPSTTTIMTPTFSSSRDTRSSTVSNAAASGTDIGMSSERASTQTDYATITDVIEPKNDIKSNKIKDGITQTELDIIKHKLDISSVSLTNMFNKALSNIAESKASPSTTSEVISQSPSLTIDTPSNNLIDDTAPTTASHQKQESVISTTSAVTSQSPTVKTVVPSDKSTKDTASTTLLKAATAVIDTVSTTEHPTTPNDYVTTSDQTKPKTDAKYIDLNDGITKTELDNIKHKLDVSSVKLTDMFNIVLSNIAESKAARDNLLIETVSTTTGKPV